MSDKNNNKKRADGKASYLKRFCSYYRPYRKMFAIDLTAAFFITLCDLVYPLLTRTVINKAVPEHSMRLLIICCASLLGVYVAKLLLSWVVNYWGHVLGVHMQGDMRRDIFSHLQQLPFGYFDENESGALMSRTVNDLQDIAELAHHGPEYFFLSGMEIVGAFVILCTINLRLTLIIFAFMPLFCVIMAVLQHRMDKGAYTTRAKTSVINAELGNSIAGIRVTKAFDNSQTELKKFNAALKDYIKARSDYYKTMAQFFCSMTFSTDLMYLVVLTAGGIFYFNGSIDTGDFAAYFLFISSFITPIRKLMQFFEMYEDGKAGFKRFCEVMDVRPEPEEPDAETAQNLAGDIVYDNVSFTYGSEKNVLSNVNIVIKNGSKTALVGPSGAGKTTLCHILPRFYDIDGGCVTIGGHDIEGYTRSSLRRLIGIVQQDVFLFSGTIADNIAYGRPDATREEIERAARCAKADDFIRELPNGYDSFVGERGVKLSGGQKQRISIARIFLKDPQILILDEATSALDSVTEQELQHELDELSHGRTTIVVAHRLSTVRDADDIVVLTERGVAEHGSHDELMQKNGLYTTLYNSQFAVEMGNNK